MSDRKFIFGVVAATLIFLVGGTLIAFKIASPNIQATSGAKASVTETSFDWGEVKMDAGKVEKTFEIKNAGSQTLKLFGVKTSCMCTTATLTLDKIISPEFGMHSESSYVLDVEPGKTANLKVVFDPAYHGPTGVGPITRQVLVNTNDSDNSKLNFMLTAMVIK